MYNKRFFFAILFRIILIIISSFAFTLLIPYLHKEYYFSLSGIGILTIFQIVDLVTYVNKTNRKLALFFDSVQNNDAFLSYSTKFTGGIFRSLYNSMDDLNKRFSEMRINNTHQNIFLNNLVEQVGVGLISYSEDGKIEILNNAAKDLLQITQLENFHDLNLRLPELYKCIQNLQPNNPQVIKLATRQSMLFLYLKLNIFKSENKMLNLLSIQDIRMELEQNELNSWQKLIQVLRHEISNSISPMVSLANTTKKYFIQKETGSIIQTDELADDVLLKTIDSLNTIETTGKGLIDFMEKYRSLTALPQPTFERFRIRDLFDKLQLLFISETDPGSIDLRFDCAPGDLELTADFSLLEKVMINLIKNAIDALGNTPGGKIQARAYTNVENRVTILVKDNGKGIPPEIADNIFIPFYTTKENGSGIGLSLSRQIMRIHRGSIRVSSNQHKETVFSLVF